MRTGGKEQAVCSHWYEPQEKTSVWALLQDLAGNRSNPIHLGDMIFDFDAPDAPATETEDGIAYTRVPWGADAGEGSVGFFDTDGAEQFFVHGLDSAVEPESVVTVYDGPNPATATEIGSGQAGNDGTFGNAAGGAGSLFLTASDRSFVWMTATDRAGNEGPAALVQNVIWVATLGNKVAESQQANPHTVEELPWCEGMLYLPDSSELDAGSGIAQSGPLAASEVAQLSWAAMDNTDILYHRYIASTYDNARGRTYAFGGEQNVGGLEKGYEWNGFVISPIVPNSPQPRFGGGMSYNVRAGAVTLLSGGYPHAYGNNVLYTRARNDMWEWSGDNWVHVPFTDEFGDLSPAGYSDPHLCLQPLGVSQYHVVHDQFIYGGGGGYNGSSSGGAGTWTLSGTDPHHIDAHAPPSAVTGHVFVYARNRKRIDLFGSSSDSSLTYELALVTWEQQSPYGPPRDAGQQGPSTQTSSTVARLRSSEGPMPVATTPATIRISGCGMVADGGIPQSTTPRRAGRIWGWHLILTESVLCFLAALGLTYWKTPGNWPWVREQPTSNGCRPTPLTRRRTATRPPEKGIVCSTTR